MPLGMSGFELGQLGLGALGGIFQGAGQGQSSQQAAQLQALQNRLAAMRNQQDLEQSIQNQRTSNSAAFADRMPLGSEQNYARQQAFLSMLPGLLQNMRPSGPTDPAVRSTFTPVQNPFQNMDFSRLNQTTSPDATARALTDRRTALAGIDPTATQHLRPLSDYGLDQQGVFNSETENRTNQRLQENQASEAAMRQKAMEIYNLSEQDAQRLERSGGGFSWRSLLGPIAGIASSFIPGVGPLLAPMIGGAVGGVADGARGAALGGLGGFGGEFIQGGFGGPNLFNRGGLPRGYGGIEGPNLNDFGMLPGNAQIDSSTPQGPGQLASRNLSAPLAAGGIPQNRPNLPSPPSGGQNARQNFINPQDLALAGGGRPQTPQAPSRNGSIPDPGVRFLGSPWLQDEGYVKGQAMMPPVGMGASAVGNGLRQIINPALGRTAVTQQGARGTAQGLLNPASQGQLPEVLQRFLQAAGGQTRTLGPGTPPPLQLGQGGNHLLGQGGQHLLPGRSGMDPNTLRQLASQLPDGALRQMILKTFGGLN